MRFTFISADAPAAATRLRAHEYLIGPGDNVNIAVWRNPEVSMNVPVRPDGKNTTPLVEDLQASGKTPTQLARILYIGEFTFQAVYVQVYPCKKIRQVVGCDSLLEGLDVEVRVDVFGHRGQDLYLGMPETGKRRPCLAVEVGQVKGAKSAINMKGAYAQARQGQ